MDGYLREEGDYIVCTLEVLRRLGRLSLGSLKCGINVLECALWSWKVNSATLRSTQIFGEKPCKCMLIEEKCGQRHIFLVPSVHNLVFFLELRDF